MTNNNTKQPISVGLIGLGRMGESHALAVKELGWEINAIYDVNSKRMYDFVVKFNLSVDKVFNTPQDLLQQKIDLVIIATTADAHCELVCLAAKHTIPYILCEKPMATSLADCDKMIKSCQSAGSLLAINHQMRFMPQYTLVKESLNSNNFGNLTSMNVVGGCFGLCMNGSHYIEAFSFLSGSSVHTAVSWLSKKAIANPRGDQFEDRGGQMRMTSVAGQRFNLEAGDDQGHGMTVTYATEYGHIFVDELSGELHAVARKKEYHKFPKTRYGLPTEKWNKSFQVADNVSCTKAVLQSLLGHENYPSGEDGRLVINALVAAHYSASQGSRPVTLESPELPYTQKYPWA